MNDKPKVVRAPRKKSSRTKGLFTRPDLAERQRERWADPEYRAKMLDVLAKNKGNRVGTPDGVRKRDMIKLERKAERKARKFIQMLKDEGEFIVPTSDTAMAEAALKEAFKLAILPGDKKIKLAAMNTVLQYTKAKPESKSKVTLETAEDWLKAAQADMKKD